MYAGKSKDFRALRVTRHLGSIEDRSFFKQCVNVCPASFLMVESGRARTFNQRGTADVDEAVASCPVNCMHRVSFRELQEYETARDEGDGRSDHKQLGNPRGPTPLYVAGIQSDNNHRTSWYHTLKSKCLGNYFGGLQCLDCPHDLIFKTLH